MDSYLYLPIESSVKEYNLSSEIISVYQSRYLLKKIHMSILKRYKENDIIKIETKTEKIGINRYRWYNMHIHTKNYKITRKSGLMIDFPDTIYIEEKITDNSSMRTFTEKRFKIKFKTREQKNYNDRNGIIIKNEKIN